MVEAGDEKKSMSIGDWFSLIKSLILAADKFQQINFLMIVLVWIGQFLKYGYDSWAMNWMEDSFVNNQEEYGNIRGIYLFNQILMYIDGTIIMLGAVSLLAYSTLLIPDVKIIVQTVTNFIAKTASKTALLILLLYIFLGLLAQYILAYYQY